MAMTLRLDENDTAALKAYAERHQMSMQQAATDAIRTLTRSERRDHIVAMVVERDRELLDRLAK